MLCNVNAQCDVNIAIHGNGNKNVIIFLREKKMRFQLTESRSVVKVRSCTQRNESRWNERHFPVVLFIMLYKVA